MTPFTQGITHLINGFALLTKPGLKRFALVPIIINIGLFAGFFFLLHHYIDIFNAWFLTVLPTWLHWLSGVIWLMFMISFLLFFVTTFITITNILSAPFNSFLAEKVSCYLTGKQKNSKNFQENFADLPRVLGRQIAIISYYLPRALLILLLFFIPLLQVAAPFIWFIFNAWFVAMTYLDYPTDNDGVPLKEVRSWMKNNKLLVLGFGISALLASLIPLMNLFIVPAAVAGGTRLWCERR